MTGLAIVIAFGIIWNTQGQVLHDYGTHTKVHGDVGVYNGQVVALDDITAPHVHDLSTGLGFGSHAGYQDGIGLGGTGVGGIVIGSIGGVGGSIGVGGIGGAGIGVGVIDGYGGVGGGKLGVGGIGVGGIGGGKIDVGGIGGYGGIDGGKIGVGGCNVYL